MLGTVSDFFVLILFETCNFIFIYMSVLLHATAYLYTCQFCWNDEWHLHMFTLNHC